MPKRETSLTYAEHLQLERLLSCQVRRSEKHGRPAHDEMLFIVVHQAYELWFKQILFELERVQATFSGPEVDDRSLGQVVQGLGRVVEIQKLLLQQLDVLETMTPLDFLDFRDLLFPASGFQSVQFRLLETCLGLRRADRLSLDERPYDARLAEADRQRLRDAEARPSLADQIESWLERTPFVSVAGYDFREVYRQAVTDMLEGEAAVIRANPALGETEKNAEIDSLAAARARFESIFDEERHRILRAQGEWHLSWQALQAALFINLYRDEPALQLPFALLSRLMDIDETMTSWRYRHALMVQRMIGRKVGTGGSSGHDYLRRTAERHRVFADLFVLSTFFIPRSQLPALPEELRQAMGYRYSGSGA
ncbi:MAG: tryptophan 2,3-dioxygenase [Rhodospirillales bacterium]|nr:tryptophan 2,3-dioxygenase [Rhodospirillales bacterium]MDH3918327.1 tryptophan 2,3-dioxygenase [Rhodospirillales bacterium]